MTITQINILKDWFCSKSDIELVQFINENIIKNKNDVFLNSIPDYLINDWTETILNLGTMNIIVNKNAYISKKVFDNLVRSHNELCKKEYNRIRMEFCNYLDSFL